MPRTSKKDRHQLEEATAKHKLNLDNDEQGTEDNSSIGSPARGIDNDSESHNFLLFIYCRLIIRPISVLFLSEETPLVPRQGKKRENEDGDEFS